MKLKRDFELLIEEIENFDFNFNANYFKNYYSFKDLNKEKKNSKNFYSIEELNEEREELKYDKGLFYYWLGRYNLILNPPDYLKAKEYLLKSLKYIKNFELSLSYLGRLFF